MLGKPRRSGGLVRLLAAGPRRWRGALAATLAISAVAVASGDLQAEGAAAPSRQYGINSLVTYRCQPTGTYLSWATTQIDRYGQLGANAIALAFPFYTTSLTSNSVFSALDCRTGQFQTPPPQLLAEIVSIAHQHGMQVLLRPLIDVAVAVRTPYTWSGLLAPTNLQEWMSSYEAVLDPYLVMAQRSQIEHVAVDSELNSLANRPAFGAVIANAKKFYTGDLVVNYTWSSHFGKRPWSGTSAGVDTYPKVHYLAPYQPAGSLLGQWDWILAHKHVYALPNISRETIDEIGIAAQVGAPAAPSIGRLLPMSTHPFNQTVQSRWFTAACRFMKEHRMRGIYFWGQEMGALHGHLLTSPSPAHTSFLQPATQQAIKACFTS
jgi:hypothetical protein